MCTVDHIQGALHLGHEVHRPSHIDVTNPLENDAYSRRYNFRRANDHIFLNGPLPALR